MTSTTVDDGREAQAGKAVSTWKLFLLLISVASFLPFAITPLATAVVPQDAGLLYLYLFLGFLGANFHVAASGWFYTDAAMRDHFRVHPLRYIVIPLVLIVGGAVTFQIVGRTVAEYVVAGFLGWQIWHYQKQNVGVLSFIAAGTGKVPLSIWERRTLALSAVAGILGFFSVDKIPPASLSELFRQLHQVGLLVYALVPVTFCIALLKTPSLRTNAARLIFFTLGAAFFAPTYLFSDQASALVGYAMAHGLQYIVLMGFISARHGRADQLVKLLVIATFGGIILGNLSHMQSLAGIPYAMAAYGAFMGVVMSHFVLDAGIWRLREPFQRAYMREKFAFIFGR